MFKKYKILCLVLSQVVLLLIGMPGIGEAAWHYKVRVGRGE